MLCFFTMANPIMVYGFTSQKWLKSFEEVGRVFNVDGLPVYTFSCCTITNTVSFSRMHEQIKHIEWAYKQYIECIDKIADRMSEEATWMMALNCNFSYITSEDIEFDDWWRDEWKV